MPDPHRNGTPQSVDHQSYTCSTPIGDVTLIGTVTGKAKIKGKTISLKKVVYSITNSVGLDLTVDHVKISTPDPSPASAPYKKGSVKVPRSPRGGRPVTTRREYSPRYAKSMTIKAGDDVTSAPFSAKYTAKVDRAPRSTSSPGDVSFNVSAPVAGDGVLHPGRTSGHVRERHRVTRLSTRHRLAPRSPRSRGGSVQEAAGSLATEMQGQQRPQADEHERSDGSGHDAGRSAQHDAEGQHDNADDAPPSRTMPQRAM